MFFFQWLQSVFVELLFPFRLSHFFLGLINYSCRFRVENRSAPFLLNFYVCLSRLGPVFVERSRFARFLSFSFMFHFRDVLAQALLIGYLSKCTKNPTNGELV